MIGKALLSLGTGFAVLFLFAVPSAVSGSVVLDRVVAVVNDEIITLSDLQREMTKHREMSDEKVLLEEMIDRRLQMLAAKKNGMDVTDREVADAIGEIMKRNNMTRQQFEEALGREGLTYDQYRSELREQMTMSRLVNKYVRTGLVVEEAEARAYYDRNPERYSLPEEIRVRHLVLKLPEHATAAQIAAAREQAEGLLARLRKGEDFVTLIRKHSSGPTAGQDGDLGFLQRGHAIPEIDEAARNLKPGEYGGPLRTGDSLQIIRLEEIRTPRMPFEKVREDILRTLGEQKLENNYRAWLQTLRSDAHIENRL
mgnify:CR=1 FL=1